MSISRKTQFKVSATTAAIKNAIIAAINSEEARQISYLQCGDIVMIVKMSNKFKTEEIINGIKTLSNDGYIQLGKGLRRRSGQNGTRYDVKFLSRKILKSSITPNEKFIFEDSIEDYDDYFRLELPSISHPISSNLRNKNNPSQN